MNRATLLIVSFLTALIAVGLFGGNYVIVALPLAAIAVTVPLFSRRPRSPAWILISIGAALWAVEEVAWGINRLGGSFDPSAFTDVTYYLGAAAWLGGLLHFPRKRLPASLIVAVLPAVGLLLWLLLSNATASLELGFPLSELLLSLVAVPLVGGTLGGGASEGRLLLVLGFYFRAIGAASYSSFAGSTEPGFLMLWLISFALIALGVYMELYDVHAELLAAAVAILSLQFFSAWLLILIYLSTELREWYVVGIVTMLAYVQFIVVMLIIFDNIRTQARAARDLESWAALLGGMTTTANDDLTLDSMISEALADVPELHGVVIHNESQRGVLAGYGYPLVADGTEVGRLYFERQPAQTNVIDMVAPLLAARVLLFRDQLDWRTAALTDPLTGLLNRRGLETHAPPLFERAQEERLPISVAMLDIDHFKRVNDVYGHGAGDEALQALANLLQRHTRPHDLAVRWGGEEFVMVLVDSDQRGCAEVMKRLRHELQVITPAPIVWPLALSIGIAGGDVPASIDDLERWLDQADKVLLTAKSAGRNRIEHHA